MFMYSLIEEDKDLQVVIKGDLDIDGTEIINEELIPKMLTYKKVNINFEDVPFVDSSGMGLLMALVHTLTENETSITISNVREDVFEVFELLQIPEILGEDIFIRTR
ncbi:MAG: lipid asymmetry maintenance protein MlaB [Paenisporosarcina sp.]